MTQPDDDGDAPQSATANVVLSIGGNRLELGITVPTGPARPIMMLPLVRHLAETVVEVAVEDVRARGEAISCRAGCGACCRQLVPISVIEARRIRDLFDELPEPHRSEIRARFAAARARLAEAGLLEKVEHPERFAREELELLGMDYLALQIACPFLEEESCSIYPDRPLICREYLVTSPAEYCVDPTSPAVRRVELPARVSRAVRRLDLDPAARSVALVVAPEWAEANPEGPPTRPGPELLRELFDQLAAEADAER